MSRPAGSEIRPIALTDYTHWLTLWNGNNLGQNNPDITAQTWGQLIDPASPIKGFLAWSNAQHAAGLLHYVLHPTTGTLQPVAYMQDLFIEPAQRRKGLAKSLIAALAALGQMEDWARIYWLAEKNNPSAQALYKSIGLQMDFSLHILPLQSAYGLGAAGGADSAPGPLSAETRGRGGV